jgi:hypothetical protein
MRVFFLFFKAVQVMAQRGVPNPIVGDVFDPYPTPLENN